MLVLTRKVGERIRIGDEIVIKVVDVDKGKIRIGIDAPENVSILRMEVYERIQEENRKSSLGATTDIEKAARMWREQGGKE